MTHESRRFAAGGFAAGGDAVVGDPPPPDLPWELGVAGDGSHESRRFAAGEHILDYRYKNGVRRAGEEVEWLTPAAFSARYPSTPDAPHGAATHVHRPRSSPYYYDTARSGGVGGKMTGRRDWRALHELTV